MKAFLTFLRRAMEKIFSLLRARLKIGAIMISDDSLRFSYFTGAAFETAGFRLPPGIVENGEIKNYDQFVDALKALRKEASAWFPKRGFASIIVTLGSSRVYTQVFSLPQVTGENLEEAIKLNIRMISPFEASQAYAGWQFVNQREADAKLDILSAFAGKEFVDRIGDALKAARFLPIAMESGALSLARLVRERGQGFNPAASCFVANVDSRGLQFLILRGGQLYFEYFMPWRDIQGSTHEISWPDFETAFKRNLHQVINFYGTHWPEPATELFVSADGYEEEILKIIKDNFSLDAKPLRLVLDRELPKESFEAAGAALRSRVPLLNDLEINLFGFTVRKEFQRNEVLAFLRFWQIAIPLSLGILLVAFAGTYLFFSNLGKSLASQSLAVSGKQSEELQSLQSEISQFNGAVSMVRQVQAASTRKTLLLDTLEPLIGNGKVNVNHLEFLPANGSVQLSGEADSQDQILAFKNGLAANNRFSAINLPLSEIKPRDKGFFFSITFVFR